MLQLLSISNIALIDELRVEFDGALNLLTGETGSGKSIIVDALGVLIGGRFTSELLKSGAERGSIEGLFVLSPNPQLEALLEKSGLNNGDELIIRRELSITGRNKIFINNQLATQSLLRDLRPFLVDIHGQGDQQTLFDPEAHLEILDSFGGHGILRFEVAEIFDALSRVQRELATLRKDAAEKFQLVDTLQFQIAELERAQLSIGEDERLEEERRRLSNVEKLTALCQSSYGRIYEDDDAALSRLRQTLKDVEELSEFDSGFREYIEGLESARAVMEDLSFALRDFADKLEFSPARLAAIEDRLAELSRLKRKYGGSIEAALEHLAQAQDRLRQIETSDEREQHLTLELQTAQQRYLGAARKLHKERVRAAKALEKAVEDGIAEVAMENARFQVQVTTDDTDIKPTGIDRVEFYFSANIGEEVKPLARVASGGEASRLMLVLKTISNAAEFPRTIVFDEIDAGIGGRVSEAVGIKLKKLSKTNQVLCVTHQPQIARFADNHLVVHKEALRGRTHVSVSKLDRAGRVEELARMLTGAEITDSARRHARELLKH
ncbi:MAG TPA: DNA repair protein RecN [Pyrinomonadaceae bacterium]|nr:DNA repair protein RecN [Pyrinomonadaceae bacterium]